MAFTQHNGSHLQAVVDMGSNGIRFSVSSLRPPTARIMPTLYQTRAGISLYDAQYLASGERQPIDEPTTEAVVLAFRQFQRTCADFGVPEENITILATEATRTASNSEAFRQRIKDAVGWEVKLMTKEEEGEVGALGIASSLPEINGLVMDLGGGSTQLSWLASGGSGTQVRMPKNGAVSMPYGAAAMSRRLAEAEKSGTVEDLRSEVKKAVMNAYDHLDIPEDLMQFSEDSGGFTLYLSGGGFRGWGYVLMSMQRVRPYPIPVINGFKASRSQFLGTDEVKQAAASTLQDDDNDIFRISDRRASQVPAVAFLINALAEALPEISEVRFCQGGVREGYLFRSLPREIQAEHPLVVATGAYSPAPSGPLLQLLQAALPPGTTANAQDDYKSVFTLELLESFANLMYYHSTHSKDLQASAALRSTTSGILASVHGILHESRTRLALLLCARWGSDVPPTDQAFKAQLEKLVESPWTLWWIQYLGAVAALIAAVYPAGMGAGVQQDRLGLQANWDTSGKGRRLLVVTVSVGDDVDGKSLEKEVKAIEKAGKKKNFIGGKDGIGHKVEVEVKKLEG
ncbi:retrograde regulation protein 2 [Saxophila tyrrhenica]|uniref:Retrograde regulation protein 2 n=1 Tax=Saxophila tyrrhenica TaxID=1690608 RepID=A0AAV9P7G2_9PEZI|nr:retrograde regulation protein 2 [Saxophila tyrrhenica]